MAIFPIETLRINPSSYSGRTAKMPDGSTGMFSSYQKAMSAGAKDIQPNYQNWPVSTTEDNDTSAQDFIQSQIDQVKEASGIMNEWKWSGQWPVTPWTNRKKLLAVTTIGPKIKWPGSPENMNITGAMSNANENNKKIRNI